MGVSVRRGLVASGLGVVLAGVTAGAQPASAAVPSSAATADGVRRAAAAAEWRVVASPPLKPASRLADISATGPRDAWAVGYQDDSYGSISPRPYALLRWNGSAWSERLLPEDRITLSGISAAGPSDVWTVGTDDDLSPYAAHWNGAAWQGYRPSGTGGASALNDVAA